MKRARLLWSVAVLGALLGAPVGAAAGAPASSKDAKRIYEEATAAFGLGKYAEAAQKYEAAFAIKPDPALLYNAAQSYRLAGNKPRALELYRNYVRLYPDGTNAEDARSHVSTLKKAIEDEQPPIEMARPPGAPSRPGTAGPPPAPPTAAAPGPGAPPVAAMPPPVETHVPAAPLPAAPAPAAGTEASVPMVSQPASPSEDQSLTHKTWFWVAVGAAVVVVGASVILLATRGEKFPDATFGTARGN